MVDINKIIAIFVVFVITFSFGVAPIWLLKILSNKVKNLSRLRYILSLTNCFGGGVFLGTAILHLMQESMEAVAESIPEVDYPLSGVLIGAGFFLVLAIEHITGLVSKDDDSPFLDHGHDHGPTTHDRTHYSEIATTPPLHSKIEIKDEICGVRPEGYGAIGQTSYSKPNDKTSAPSVCVRDPKKKTTIIDVSGDGRSRTTKRIRTVILVIALSIHMIFEGTAIGLQDTVSSVWTLVAAISVHKAVIVFSVGMKMKEVVEGNIRIVFYIMYLSLVSPVGIAIGLVVTSTGAGDESAQEISSGILQSLAAGTFLYVTFFEILQKELTNGYSLPKVFVCMLGFAAMAGLKVLDAD